MWFADWEYMCLGSFNFFVAFRNVLSSGDTRAQMSKIRSLELLLTIFAVYYNDVDQLRVLIFAKFSGLDVFR